MYDVIFSVDAELKREFLETKITKTSKTNSYVLKQVDEYEEVVDKKVYNMNINELKELFLMKFANASLGSLTTNVSIIRNYVDFCISKGAVSHFENRLVFLTRKELRNLVNQQALKIKYISKEQLREYQNILCNEQDVALLEAFYIGIRGRAKKEATFEEVINLQIDVNDPKFKNENFITLVRNNGDKRVIQISDESKQILLDAYYQNVYVSNNGEEHQATGRIKNTKINRYGDYVFCSPGANKCEKFMPSLISARIHRIQKWIGNTLISPYSLYMSGMINMAKELKEEKGQLTMDDYAKICERYDYGVEDEITGEYKYYANILKDVVEQYEK